MKIRNGFVSNSSSSSFIISIKGEDTTKCPTCFQGCGLIELIKNMGKYNDNYAVYSEGYDEVKSSLLDKRESDWRCANEIEEIRTTLKKIEDEKRKGNEVYEVSVSRHGELIYDVVDTNSNVKILHQECD